MIPSSDNTAFLSHSLPPSATCAHAWHALNPDLAISFRLVSFQSSELEALSREINPTENSPLDGYYPLTRGTRGERFPTNDPLKESILEPRPGSRREYLHGLLQAIARCVRGLTREVEAGGSRGGRGRVGEGRKGQGSEHKCFLLCLLCLRGAAIVLDTSY